MKNRAYVDALSCITIPLRVIGEDAVNSLLQLCALRSVPEPSLLLTSGESVTALWLLRYVTYRRPTTDT